MKTFFITGLPRTRTAWMANLFTTERTHCYHEWLKGCSTFKEFDSGKEYTGNSDCGLVVFYEFIEKLFPGSPVVIIERPEKEVVESLLANFPDAEEDQMRHVVDSLAKKIEHIKNTSDVFTMPFDILGETEAIKTIWRHCIPTIPLDTKRLELLQQLKTTVKYSSFREALEQWHG